MVCLALLQRFSRQVLMFSLAPLDGSPAQGVGPGPGDIILKVNGQANGAQACRFGLRAMDTHDGGQQAVGSQEQAGDFPVAKGRLVACLTTDLTS